MFDEDTGTIPVTLPSGADIFVLTQNEKEYFENISNKYLEDNSFSNIADITDLDRLLIGEVINYRWQQWLLADQDYDGELLDDPIALSKQLNEKASELRQLKKSMGLDKVSRDRNKGEDVASYIDTLTKRAKQFGIMRNEQSVKSINLWKDIEAQIIFHDRCNEIERKENDIQESDIISWIRDVAIPEFNKIDEAFRNTTQKYWDQM